MDTNQLSIATTTYLSELRLFSEQKTIQFDGNLAELLMDIVQSIEQLVATADIIPIINQNNNGPQSNVSVYCYIEQIVMSSFVLYIIGTIYFVSKWTKINIACEDMHLQNKSHVNCDGNNRK